MDNLNLPDKAWRLRTDNINVQQAVIQPRARYLDTVRENERALKLPCGDTAMKVNAAAVVLVLLALDKQLVVDGLDRQVAFAEAGNGQRDAEPVLAELLDIVRRITIRGFLRDPVERALELIESEQQRGC